MGQQNVLIPYETIAAYNASLGIALYNGDSGQNSDVNFHVNWDPVRGFTERGWDIGVPNSPAEDKTLEEIQYEINENRNLDDLFDDWHRNVSAANRLQWMMQKGGCVV